MFDFVDEAVIAKLKGLLSAVLLYGGLAILGGITRIMFGIQNGESIKNSVVKYGLVSLPIGVFFGWGVEELTHAEFAPFAAAFLAGHISYNIITNFEQKSTKWFIEIITRGKFK